MQEQIHTGNLAETRQSPAVIDQPRFRLELILTENRLQSGAGHDIELSIEFRLNPAGESLNLIFRKLRAVVRSHRNFFPRRRAQCAADDKQTKKQ